MLFFLYLCATIFQVGLEAPEAYGPMDVNLLQLLDNQLPMPLSLNVVGH